MAPLSLTHTESLRMSMCTSPHTKRRKRRCVGALMLGSSALRWRRIMIVRGLGLTEIRATLRAGRVLLWLLWLRLLRLLWLGRRGAIEVGVDAMLLLLRVGLLWLRLVVLRELLLLLLVTQGRRSLV
jgi:hypothetical protein